VAACCYHASRRWHHQKHLIRCLLFPILAVQEAPSHSEPRDVPQASLTGGFTKAFSSGSTPNQRLDWSGEGTGLVCIGCVGQRRRLPVGHEATPSGPPVREFGTAVFPLGERCLVAQMVRECSRAEMQLGVHEGFDLRSPISGRDVPPHFVSFGQGVDAQVALSVLRLLDHGGCVREELVERRVVPQP
jgi:hypothetical protein